MPLKALIRCRKSYLYTALFLLTSSPLAAQTPKVDPLDVAQVPDQVRSVKAATQSSDGSTVVDGFGSAASLAGTAANVAGATNLGSGLGYAGEAASLTAGATSAATKAASGDPVGAMHDGSVAVLGAALNGVPGCEGLGSVCAKGADMGLQAAGNAAASTAFAAQDAYQQQQMDAATTSDAILNKHIDNLGRTPATGAQVDAAMAATGAEASSGIPITDDTAPASQSGTYVQASAIPISDETSAGASNSSYNNTAGGIPITVDDTPPPPVQTYASASNDSSGGDQGGGDQGASSDGGAFANVIGLIGAAATLSAGGRYVPPPGSAPVRAMPSSPSHQVCHSIASGGVTCVNYGVTN